MPCKMLKTVVYLDYRVKAFVIIREDAVLVSEVCEERKAMIHTTEATSLVRSKYLTQFVRWIAPYKGCITQDIIKAAHAPGLDYSGKLDIKTSCTLFPCPVPEFPSLFLPLTMFIGFVSLS
jgi:hypothetical protein